MKTYTVPNDIVAFHEGGLISDILAKTTAITEPWLPTNRFAEWTATVRRKIVRGEYEGVKVERSLRRDRYEWKVHDLTVIVAEDFTAHVETELGWDYDPSKPFPHTSYTNEMWDEVTYDAQGLALSGCVGAFLRFIGIDRGRALPIIEACEDDGLIDAMDAALARLRV